MYLNKDLEDMFQVKQQKLDFIWWLKSSQFFCTVSKGSVPSVSERGKAGDEGVDTVATTGIPGRKAPMRACL